MMRVEGVDMGGFELTQRARQHIACIGVMNDAAGMPESDGSNAGGVAGEAPDVLYQYSRFVNFRGTDLDHYTSTGVDNVASLAKLERLSSTRFRFTLKEPFPEGLPRGRVSPVRRITVANCTWNGSNLPLQGANWNYEIDNVIDDLTFEGTIQSLGKDRYAETAAPMVSETGTGGRVWLYKTGKGQHSDSLFQIEDEKPVASLTVENCVTSGNYQVPGIIGTPGTPFLMRNVHAFKIFADPQDPTTQNLYIKGTYPGHFEGCYFEMQFGRPLEYYSVYPRTPEVYTDKAGAYPRLTWRPGGRLTGEVIDGPAPVDFAPSAAIGTNWSGGNYAGYTAPTADSLKDITLKLDTLSASMAPGARVGVIDVVHSTKGEIIELEITGDTANVAGVSAKSGTKLIRRGLVVGLSRLASGATYTVTITARIRSNPKISIQKTFKIAVP